MFQGRNPRCREARGEYPDHWRASPFVLGGVLLVGSVLSQNALAGDETTMVLATTNTPNERVRATKGQLPEDKPGWFVELSRRAATECGAKLVFAFMPWPRALQMVERGEVQAAFNSSYKPDRAEYGAYPLKDGKPDEDRASKRYAYVAYVAKDADKEKLADADKLRGHTVAAERDASIIPELKERGASVYEVTSDLTMLRMAANGRVDAAVAIEDNVDALFDQHPNLAERLTKLQPPIQKRVGYVMFSKIFYKDNRELVECFWSTSAQLRDTEWFQTMRATYD